MLCAPARAGCAGLVCLLTLVGCAGTGMTSSSTRTDPGITAASPSSPASPGSPSPPGSPRFGQSVLLAPAGGRVRIALPGAARTFVRLRSARVVPVGTVVDTAAGAVDLTSATPPPGRTQTGRFHAGVFEIRQNRAQGGLVNLVIRDNLPRGPACAVRARLGLRVLGLLRGNARGRFRTTGRFAAATIRGTEWGVRDRCDGTLVLVQRGVVDVRDFRLRKDILVQAGHTYLAKAP